MDPAVVAAVIAASVSLLTLIVSVVAQAYGIRKASRDTEETLKQLDRTLAEQRDRTRNERFATAADRLGSDKPPAVQLAGVYAMAGLADDWEANRQTCVDVLCAYLRMPYEPDPGPDAPEPERRAFRASREARHTVIRVITAHLKHDAAESWQSLTFDLTGVVFDGGDFSGAEFSSGTLDFSRAEFSGGTVHFNGAKFSGGPVDFFQSEFSGGTVDFGFAEFSGGAVYFAQSEFSSGLVEFGHAEFSDGGKVDFRGGRFSGGTVDFTGTRFSGGEVRFDGAWFSGGEIDFNESEFSGGYVFFGAARFRGATLDFSHADVWSYPPTFPWTDTPPPGVKLPNKEDQSQT